ncbi:MAG: DUF3987 domain-containing protein [Pseudomonadota bacterium]|nr:DUF3987 domain-containing protein [Pseudomonadota bacterium]
MTVDLDRIREALQLLPAGDRDAWVRMGMAIKSEVGDAGFDAWDAWSQQAENYNSRDARDVWKSIKAGGGVNIGTLYHEAKVNGWRDDGVYQAPTPEEIAERRRDAAERAAKDEAETARERAEAAKNAAAIWKAATPATADNPYLKRKRVAPVATLREIDAGAAAAILGYVPKSGGDALAGRLLVVPVKQGDRISTLELIDGDKRKAALAGRGTKAGGYWAAQPLPDGDGAGLTLLIGEGVATGLSGKEASGHPVIAALSAGNLPAVAKAMRERYPAAALVILADLVKTTGAPDPHAIEAAHAVGGVVAVPDFGPDRDPDMTDFNDLAQACGPEAVGRCIANAAASTRATHQQAEWNAPAGNADGGGWPEPQPLPDGLPPVAAFDLALLPDTLKPWAADICERVQCAPDFVAVAIMAGLGSIIGHQLGIRPQARTDWTETPNQWALVVGRPGVLKSPALEAALSPIKRLAAAATEAHQAEAKDYARAVKLAKLRAEEGEKAARKVLSRAPDTDVSNYLNGEEPDAPTARRYIAVDSNAASLGELHRQNPNGLLVHRDEMVSLLKALDREDQAEARGFYLTGWNGNSSYTFDRIGRGLNLHIPAVCLSMLGSTQPGRIAEYIRHAVKGGAGDDGLIQRFGLLVWPDTGGDWRNMDKWPDGEAKRAAFQVYETLDRLDVEAIGAQRDTDQEGEPDGLPYLRFDAGGLGLFLEWRTDLETRLRGGDLHPAMESHLAKYRKLVPSLALVLHLAGGGTGPVTERATLQALAWAEYLETHARRAYASVTMPEVGAAKAIIARIRKGDLARTFSSRDVWRPGWAMLSDREQVADALSLLVELDWLAASRSDTGGRPGTVYEANPRGFA